MSLFRNSQGEIKDIPQARYDAWVSSSNPKAQVWIPYAVDAQPAFDAATQKVVAGAVELDGGVYRQRWTVVSLTQAELDAIADAAERQTVKDLRSQLALDIDEAIADQAEAQAFIDLNGSATATDRNNEIRNSAQRDKKSLQRERRYARALRFLLKQA